MIGNSKGSLVRNMTVKAHPQTNSTTRVFGQHRILTFKLGMNCEVIMPKQCRPTVVACRSRSLLKLLD